MKLFRSLLLVGLSVVGVVSARMEKMPIPLTCADFVHQAEVKLGELYDMIQQKRNFMQVARFANKESSDNFRAEAAKEIKDSLQQVKTLINKAEKKADVAL